MAEAPLTVVIAEDEPLAREGLRLLLRADPEVAVVVGGDAMNPNRIHLLSFILYPCSPCNQWSNSF